MKPVDNNKEHNQDKQQEQGKGPNSPSVKLNEEQRKVTDKDVSLEENLNIEGETIFEAPKYEAFKSVKKERDEEKAIENMDNNTPPANNVMNDPQKSGL